MEIKIYGIEKEHYYNGISKKEFKKIAEDEGNVWTRNKFNSYGIPIGDLILRVYY